MKRRQGVPHPYEIWLDVSFAGLRSERAQWALTAMCKWRGYRTSLNSDEKAALRYAYNKLRAANLAGNAVKVLRRAGLAQPRCSSFVIWRLQLPFATPPSPEAFGRMSLAIESPNRRTVLGVHSFGGRIGERAGMTVEFRGQPAPQLLRQVFQYSAPFRAA